MYPSWIKLLVFIFVSVRMYTVSGAALRQQACQAGDCQRGELYDLQSGSCQPCPFNTFSDADSHNCTSCKPCSLDDLKEGVIIKSHCVPTRDAEFGCADGYFHSEPQLDSYTCAPCTMCKTGYHTKLSCSPTNDTVCEQDSSNNGGGSKKITEWLIPLLAVAVPATVLVIIFALLSLNKVSSLQRKFLCHGRMEDDEVSIVETYKHLEEERKEKRKRKKAKEKAKREAAASSSK